MKFDKTKAAKWLGVHWDATLNCPICRNDDWNMPGEVVYVKEYNMPNSSDMGDTTYPKIMLICSKCGHTIFFNAVLMGLVEG